MDDKQFDRVWDMESDLTDYTRSIDNYIRKTVLNYIKRLYMETGDTDLICTVFKLDKEYVTKVIEEYREEQGL